MVLTVLENAYLKKAQECENYNDTHQKILLTLFHQKKYFQKNELLCYTNHSEKILDKAIKELEKTGTIKTEGWLIKINDYENLNQKIIEDKSKRQRK